MEKFVTYQQAVALKEIGYNKYSWFGMECSLYKADGKHTFYANGIGDETYISAPLKSEAFQWFRKEHNIQSYIYPRTIEGYKNGRIFTNYIYTIKPLYGNNYIESDGFESYEEAEPACIDKLIEIVKNNF